MDQRLASLEHDVLQPRPAMGVDVQVDTKTRERTEGAAKVVQAMHGDNFSTKRIRDGPKSSTTFDEKVEPPALPCRDGVVVENGATAPKSCLSLLEVRTTTAAGWLILHRRKLYSNKDHLRPLNSLVLPERRDTLENFNYNRLERQQVLDKPTCCPLLP